jgi:hypothetical protein
MPGWFGKHSWASGFRLLASGQIISSRCSAGNVHRSFGSQIREPQDDKSEEM